MLYRDRTEAGEALAERLHTYDDASPLVLGLPRGGVGVTARAALLSLRKQNPKQLIFAAPVCARDSAMRLAGEADRVVCAAMPEPFSAVGLWYDDFRQTEDDEVIALLQGESRFPLHHEGAPSESDAGREGPP